jgi:RHS repeat-associated protein
MKVPMKYRVVSELRRSALLRFATSLVIAGQLLAGSPVFAQDAARAVVKTSDRAIATAQRKLAKASVRVNRTVQAVTAPNIDPMFGVHVTTDALMRARIFPELLIPTGEPTPDDNAALARTLERFALAPAEHRGAIIDAYVQDRPSTPWRASLVANIATLYQREGYFSRAAAYWDQVWELTRASDEPRIRTIADYALGQSIDQMVQFGQVARLEARLKETEGRSLRGPAAVKVPEGWESLHILKAQHHMAIFSGPEALKMYLTVNPIANLDAAVRTIASYHPSHEGTSMAQLRQLGASVGLSLTMWHAPVIETFPVPSVVHFRSQHFSAIVEFKDGKYRLRDPGLGGDVWMSEAALRDETSGYVMAAARPQGGEWREVSDGETASVVGHCFPGKPSNEDPPGDSPACGGEDGPGGPGEKEPENTSSGGGGGGNCGGPGGSGMPFYRFHPTSASLIIDDSPVGYTPPVGPNMRFRLAYNHRSAKQPSTFGYGNVGPLWTFNSLAYVSDNGWLSVPPYNMTGVYLRGHGGESYGPTDDISPVTRARLVQISHNPARYERRLQDGTVEVYSLADRASTLANRRVFLTSVTDPQGHTVEYTYDSSFRLVAVTDALGQVTTFAYEHTSNPDLLTKVTDPFGRFAIIGYDAQGRLNSITDAAGMTSTFSYGTDDFIVAMTTPYGTTTFQHEPSPLTFASYRMVEATDPVGGRERLEFHTSDTRFAATAPSAEVPAGFSDFNDRLDNWNSFYWDKQAMVTGAGDYAKAVNYNWMMAASADYGHPASRLVPHSIKRPLENRVWYSYPGQGTSGNGTHYLSGANSRPIRIGRVLDNGASQVTQLAYNGQGKVTSVTDPAGRTTTYAYATNGLDLLNVQQTVSGGTALLGSLSGYDTRHLPATVTDGAGNDTELTYNSFGQPLTITNAKSEVTTLGYETGTQNLLTITGALSGATTTLTYDAYHRIASVETSDGYVVEMTYDALDRPTSRTYPDGTTEVFTYDRLDLVAVKDRLGRITRHFYDDYGRRIATRDPEARTVSYDWCRCGTLTALIDAKGQRTTWERDLNSRVTREIRADGTTDTIYGYDLAGRLTTITDPLDQVTTYTYNVDDSLASTGFTNETIATPNISHTYDPYYARPLTMVDGNGTTSYTYVAPGTNGAGQLASVDGPFTNDTITYTYDELGRVATRLLNGTGTELAYDALGRLAQLEFPIGTFDYTYDGHTGRRSSVAYPNGQTTVYSYFDDEHDFRLQTIHHKNPSAATLSKFDYTYDTVGNILTWRQERAGSAAKRYTFTHDLVDQLTSALLTDTNSTPTVLKRQAWDYDAAGNRTVDQTDDAVFATTHDDMNRLQARAPGGPVTIAGSLNEAATVTIDGQPAAVDGAHNFSGTAQIASGTTTVTVKAKDYSGNETTKQYEIDAVGSTTSYTHDANGNLTADGTKTYFWNALNQLVEVKEGTTTIATFEYDGEGRRTEKVAGGVAHQYTYDAEDIVEDRISGSTTDTLRYYHGAGIDEPLARKNSSAVVIYYLADHLGSIVQETTVGGSAALQREDDPWGKPITGGSSTGYAFSGREWDAEIGLLNLRNRYYDPALGRFINEDPIGFYGGLNFFQYAVNRPSILTDPFGLDPYAIITVNNGLSVGGIFQAAVQGGTQLAVNLKTGDVTGFYTGGLGGTVGVSAFRGGGSIEVGYAELDSVDQLSGVGYSLNAFAAGGGQGASFSFSGFASGGPAVGAGAGISALLTFSRNGGTVNLGSLPKHIQDLIRNQIDKHRGANQGSPDSCP